MGSTSNSKAARDTAAASVRAQQAADEFLHAIEAHLDGESVDLDAACSGLTAALESVGAPAHAAVALANHIEEQRRQERPALPEVELFRDLFAAWAKDAGPAVAAPTVEPQPRLLTYAEVGQVLGGRSAKTVQRLVADGVLPVVRIAGRPRVHVADLDAFLDDLRPPPVDPGGPRGTIPTDREEMADAGPRDQEDQEDRDGKDRAA